VVHIDQPIIIAQLTFKQVIQLGEDLRQQHLLLVLHRTAARFRQGLQLVITTFSVQGQAAQPLVLQPVVGQHHLGQVHPLALAPKIQQR